MAANAITPGWVNIKYQSNAHEHHMVFQVQPIDPEDHVNPTVATKSGDNANVGDWLNDEFGPAWAAFYHSEDSLIEWELWSKPTLEDDPVNLYTGSFDQEGTGVGGTRLVSGQAVFSFRSLNGGIFKSYLMEPFGTVNQRVARSSFSGILTAYKNVFLTGTCPVQARDNGFLQQVNYYTTKTNDALRKKYLLSA